MPPATALRCEAQARDIGKALKRVVVAGPGPAADSFAVWDGQARHAAQRAADRVCCTKADRATNCVLSYMTDRSREAKKVAPPPPPHAGVGVAHSGLGPSVGLGPRRGFFKALAALGAAWRWPPPRGTSALGPARHERARPGALARRESTPAGWQGICVGYFLGAPKTYPLHAMQSDPTHPFAPCVPRFLYASLVFGSSTQQCILASVAYTSMHTRVHLCMHGCVEPILRSCDATARYACTRATYVGTC